jgi:broad specificity phosphatase PhoE
MGTLLFVRHGQASFGASDYDALSPLGFEQARTLGRVLKDRGVRTAAVRGTMRRHRETADACLEQMGLTLDVREDAGLDEYDHEEMLLRFRPELPDMAALLAELSQLENPRRAFQRMFQEAMARWASGEHDADYREPWRDFVSRVHEALERAATDVGSGSTLLFTSGGPVAVIVQHLLGVPAKEIHRLAWGIANCSITKITIGGRTRHVSSFNEHGHFEADGARLLSFR